METLLAGIATLFALFLVMAAAIETVLEVFRGVLERLGFTVLKGGVSLDDALKISSEFVPPDSAAAVKVAALAGVARQTQKVSQERLDQLEALKNELEKVAGAEPTANVIANVSQTVSAVRTELDASERRRIFILRLISVVIGWFLAWSSGFDALHLAANSVADQALQDWAGYTWPHAVGYVVTGVAAASGSSYWHDKLDKVRSLKGVLAQATGRT